MTGRGVRKKEKLARLQQVTDRAADALEQSLQNSEPKQLKDAVAALKELVYITRDVYDMPTRAQVHAMRLAEQKAHGDLHKGAVEAPEGGVIEIAMQEEGDGAWPET